MEESKKKLEEAKAIGGGIKSKTAIGGSNNVKVYSGKMDENGANDLKNQ